MPASSYRRGSEIPVSVYVRRGDTPVTGANVSYRDPDAKKRFLREVSNGVYEDIYTLSLNTTLGDWVLAIQAINYEQGTLQAGASVPISIEIGPMIFGYTLVEPSRSQFIAGEVVDIIISVKFENGTPVKGAIVTTESPSGNTIVFDEQDTPGYYRASYLTTNLDNGSWSMSILAQDVFGNIATIDKRVLIRENLPPIPPWGWIVIVSVLIATLAYWKLQGETRFYIWRYRKLETENKRIETMKGIVEEKYFNRMIDQKTYTKLMRQYEEKTVSLLSRVAQIQKKIKKGKNKK
jgi:hypothetical protein